MDDPGFATATRRYAAWLGGYMRLRPEGLRQKKEKMGEGGFAFLRATFYRWRWQSAGVAEAVRDVPAVLSVGDAHLENFATWRDAEGRLAWGVSDFDDATRLPFTNDLVRLATSILVAEADDAGTLKPSPADAVRALLLGYREGLTGGTPFILEEGQRELRLAAEAKYDPTDDWAGIRSRGTEEDPPGALRDLLVTSLPEGAEPGPVRAVDDKGLGSLGRPRWIMVADWRGGPLAREAKAAAPSAWRMDEAGRPDPIAEHRLAALLVRRAPDPMLRVATRRDGSWVVRRLSPEARKVSLKAIAKVGSQETLLRAMGADIANLHAGAGADPADLLRCLDALGAGSADWLHEAAARAKAGVDRDRARFGEDPDVVAWMPP